MVYGHRVYVRWSGRGFGDCNDILFLPQRLDHSVLFAPSKRLPVVVSILYTNPDIVEEVEGFVVNDAREFTKCLFNHAEILARDIVAMDYIPKTRNLLEELSKENREQLSLEYLVDTETIYRDLLDTSIELCRSHNKLVEEVILGPQIESFEKTGDIVYSVSGQFMYIYDGVNHVFVDIRDIDPFEIGEDFLLIVYGVYRGSEYTYTAYMGEETIEEDHLRKLVEKRLENILREDGKLKPPNIIAEELLKLIED